MRARVRARDVMLALDRPERISALNVLPATVRASPRRPARRTRSSSSTPAATGSSPGSPARRSPPLALAPGMPLWAIVKAVSFDRGNRPGARPPRPRACGLHRRA